MLYYLKPKAKIENQSFMKLLNKKPVYNFGSLVKMYYLGALG